MLSSPLARRLGSLHQRLHCHRQPHFRRGADLESDEPRAAARRRSPWPAHPRRPAACRSRTDRHESDWSTMPSSSTATAALVRSRARRPGDRSVVRSPASGRASKSSCRRRTRRRWRQRRCRPLEDGTGPARRRSDRGRTHGSRREIARSISTHNCWMGRSAGSGYWLRNWTSSLGFRTGSGRSISVLIRLEDGGVGADAEREGEYRHGSETGGATHRIRQAYRTSSMVASED